MSLLQAKYLNKLYACLQNKKQIRFFFLSPDLSRHSWVSILNGTHNTMIRLNENNLTYSSWFIYLNLLFPKSFGRMFRVILRKASCGQDAHL